MLKGYVRETNHKMMVQEASMRHIFTLLSQHRIEYFPTMFQILL
jgi:hypothetical protein